jgi:Bacterial Ig domain
MAALSLGSILSTALLVLIAPPVSAQTGDPTPPFPINAVGVVGCSNTSQHLSGYRAQSSLDQVNAQPLGGLSFDIWGNPLAGKYGAAWAKYDGSRPAAGYMAAWVMLCIDDADGFDTETLLTEVVEQIRLRDPAIPIYVSPINGYPPGHVCGRVGARGVDVGRAAVEWGIEHLGVQYGPVTGVPTIDLVAADLCHLSPSGITHVGAQLVAWFDNGGWQTPPPPKPDRPPLPPLSPSDLAGPLGVVGCSNTVQHVEGYSAVSALDKFWSVPVIDYEGGVITSWGAGGTSQWQPFEAKVAASPPTAVWLQICLKGNDVSPLPMSLEQQVDLTYSIERLNGLLPGSPVIVSPLNGFADGGCLQTGVFGQPNTVALADWAVAENLAVRGPKTGPLPLNMLATDKCGLNDAGKLFVGAQLVDFFDGDQPPPPSDTVPPSVSVTAPVSGATVSGTTTVSMTASDNVAVASVQVKVDGTTVATDTTTPYTHAWNTTTVTNGSHTVTAVATDTSGNTATSTAVTVTVSNTVPTGQFTASPNPATTGQLITFTDTHPGNHRRTITYGDGTQASAKSKTFTKTYTTAGTYTATLQTVSVTTGLRVTLTLTVTITGT